MMKAGVYYVGDLCYVIRDDDWDEVCSITTTKTECLHGEFALSDGRKFAMYGTYWGDGEYCDQQKRRYLVDSGTIGCVLMSDITGRKNDIRLDDIFDTRGGQVIEFKEDFYTNRNEDGVIKIGHVVIDTRSDDTAVEEDEEEMYDD